CGFALLLLFIALVTQDGFAAQANLVALNCQHLHENLIAFLQLVANGADARLRDFAYVEQSIRAGEKLDEGTEIRDANNGAEICLADLGGRGDITNHLQRGFGGGAVVGEDVHLAVVHYVNLHAGRFDDRADFLSARPYQVANFVRGNREHVQVRSVGGNLRASCGDRSRHDIEDFEAGFASLFEGLAHDGDCDASDFDVHLKRGDSLPRAGDLEVHIAVMIFGASDIGKNCVLIVFDHQAHRDSGAGRFERDAGVHQ